MFIVPVSRRAVPSSRSFDRLFDDAFDRFFAHPSSNDSTPARRPAIDVSESDSQYVVTLDVPGVSREDVKVSIDGRKVAIVAEARQAEPAAGDAAPASASEERVIVRERAVASFARSFTLPKEIDQSASQAKLDNGVLTLTLTKRTPTASQLTVN